MNKTILAILVACPFSVAFAQMQIGNSDFEQWETVSSGQEPVNWNSFLSAGGSLSWAASDQLMSSTDVRPGSTGAKSAKLFSNEVMGIIANGNLTLGKINMGSATPTSSNNYNSSVTANTAFSEIMTDSPDSLVFWAKFTPAASANNDSARVSAILHDAYDLRDPIDAGSTSHVVATAIRNYPSTAGNWVRISVPFTYTGPASTPAFILITFTTNKTPGGGSDNDQVWIDDLELVYNVTGLTKPENAFAQIAIHNNALIINTPEDATGKAVVYNAAGQIVHAGTLTDEFIFHESGLYIVHLTTSYGILTQKLLYAH